MLKVSNESGQTKVDMDGSGNQLLQDFINTIDALTHAYTKASFGLGYLAVEMLRDYAKDVSLKHILEDISKQDNDPISAITIDKEEFMRQLKEMQQWED